MKKIARSVLLAGVSCMAITLNSACSGADPYASSNMEVSLNSQVIESEFVEEFKDNPVNLKFWNPITGPDASYLQTLVSEYNKQFGDYVSVSSDAQAEATHYQRILTSFTDNSTADICIVHKSRIASYERSNKLRPLDDIASSIDLKASDYVGDTWSSSILNNKLYSIPYDVLPTLLYYNRNLIPTGWTEDDILSDDFTMEDMYEMMKAAYKPAPTSLKTTYGIAFNYAYTENMFISLLNQQGETIVHADNPLVPTFNCDKGYKAAEKIKNIPFVKDSSGNKVASESGADHLNIFDQGRALFTIDGVWSAPELCNKTAKVNAGVALMPKVDASAERKVAADSHCFVTFNTVKESNEHRDKAIAHFIDFMVKNTHVWCEGGKVSARQDITQVESYCKLEWGYLSNKLDRLVNPVITYTYTTISEPIGKYVARLCEGTLTDVQAAINQAATDAQQAAQEL